MFRVLTPEESFHILETKFAQLKKHDVIDVLLNTDTLLFSSFQAHEAYCLPSLGFVQDDLYWREPDLLCSDFDFYCSLLRPRLFHCFSELLLREHRCPELLPLLCFVCRQVTHR